MNAQIAEQTDTGTTIAEYSPTAQALTDLRARYECVVFDVTSGKGMEQAKKGRAELREHRVALEKERVRIKAPALERSRQIDSEAKRITAEIEALEKPIDAQIKAEEERKANAKAEAERLEAERIAAINARFDAIKALPLQATGTADECRALIAQAEAIDPASFPDDLVQAAKFEQRMAINGLRAALDRIEQAEADRAELEALRASQAAVQAEAERLAKLERERVAAEEAAIAKVAKELRDEEIRAQAAADAERRHAEAIEQARLDAIAAAERAEREQAEAVRQAEVLAEQKAAAREQARLAVEQEQREADEKRAANRKHVGAINRAARDAVMAEGFDEEQATRIVTAIAARRIPAVSIAY